MPVTKWFIVGSLTVPSSWIAVLMGFLISAIAVRIRFGKQVAERYSDLLFLFIIVWKFSVILTDFPILLQSPLSILYFSGGKTGFFLGILAVGGKVLFEISKKRIGLEEVLKIFAGVVLLQAVHQVLMVLLNKGEFLAQLITIVLFVLFVVLLWVYFNQWMAAPYQMILFYGAVHFFVASFQPQSFTGIAVIGTAVTCLFFVGFVAVLRRLETRSGELL